MSSPSQITIKRLFALSGNICAFRKCTQTLIDERSGSVLAEICHIKGKRPNSPRYDVSQNDEERDAFENLILMCPIHHKIIDDDEISYTVERLQQIKSNYESRPTASAQLNPTQQKLEALLERHLQLLVEEKQSLDDSRANIKEENSHLTKLRQLASEKAHDDLRNKWFGSYGSLDDVFNSINKIFSLTKKHFAENPEYAQIGITLGQEKQTIFIVSDKYGSQIKLYGYDALVPERTSLNNVCLKLASYERIQNFGHITTKLIKEIPLYPDINPESEVVWTDKKSKPMILSGEGVSNKCFELLINQIKSPSNSTSGFIEVEDWY